MLSIVQCIRPYTKTLKLTNIKRVVNRVCINDTRFCRIKLDCMTNTVVFLFSEEKRDTVFVIGTLAGTLCHWFYSWLRPQSVVCYLSLLKSLVPTKNPLMTRWCTSKLANDEKPQNLKNNHKVHCSGHCSRDRAYNSRYVCKGLVYKRILIEM